MTKGEVPDSINLLNSSRETDRQVFSSLWSADVCADDGQTKVVSRVVGRLKSGWLRSAGPLSKPLFRHGPFAHRVGLLSVAFRS